MSELISRKSVLDKIEKALLIDDLTVGEKTVLSDVATMISLEPTVNTRTPMDNIVEKLESAENYYCDDEVDEGGDLIEFKAIKLETAINIVRQEINNGKE